MSQIVKTKFGRRSFVKRSALATGGFAIGFSWLYSCEQTPKMVLELPDEWFNFNGYLKIGDNVEIAGGSGVIKDIPGNSKVMGYPAKNIRKFLKENK